MLIGITGGKGSGKDTFAEGLGFYNLKMADPLKNMLRMLYRCANLDEELLERKLEGDLKEEPCPILGGQTPRHAMQTLGTEWRNMIDRDLWLNIWRSKASWMLKEGLSVVCSDIRFDHEADTIRRLGGTLIRVHRPGREDRDNHISEREMEGLEVDATIYNIGSIEDLHEQAHQFIQDHTK